MQQNQPVPPQGAPNTGALAQTIAQTINQKPPGALRPEKGFSAGTLKLVAIIAMTIDHLAWAFVPTASVLGVVMHFIGRITGPTMFYLLAEGVRHTRNVGRYTLRLGIFALISWPAFYYFEFGALPNLLALSFTPFGVIYTLFLSLLALRARREINSRVLRVLAVAACILLSALGDWAFYGVVFTLIFDVFYGRRLWANLLYTLVVLYSAAPALFSYFTLLAGGEEALRLAASAVGVAQGRVLSMLLAGGIIQLGQFLPLALLQFYTGKRGGEHAAPRLKQVNKWFFYVYYPLHLLIIGWLCWQVVGSGLAG